ncbi:MAG: Crp/Fnr family transcriptional regulator [Treponema sp.]|jgi:CRP-like cAMP-binding protein|nr:Crp/Fnr family transcriptional regulator [Treponema sp.]
MPKAMQYTKGSIIYFAGDKDDRVFILQKGLVILTSTDIESNTPITEQVKNGEFFGVKSALGHFPREETATVLFDSIIISMPVTEFEKLFSSNRQLIMKMLRVFSNQLRQIHKKTDSILNNKNNINQETGMLEVAQSFYKDGQYISTCDVCTKYLQCFPASENKEVIEKLYQDAKTRADKLQSGGTATQTVSVPINYEGTLKQFALPAFERFAKLYDPGNVIISEFEPGTNFYLIQSGEVQLVKCVNSDKKNLDILKPGEFFGEMAILDNSPRSATCVAINKVEVLEFTKENFQVLITGNPQIALILLKLFCKRIYDQKRRFRILVLKDLQARIADVFLMFDEMNPAANPYERQRKFNLTIADIAHWAGLSPEITHDEINKFVEKRKIEVYDNYIVVSNIADMERLVGAHIQLKN